MRTIVKTIKKSIFCIAVYFAVMLTACQSTSATSDPEAEIDEETITDTDDSFRETEAEKTAYSNEESEKTSVTIEESEVLTALRVTSDENLEKEIDSLKSTLNNKNSTTEEKNKAFEKMKNLNENKAKELEIEKKIEETHKLKSFVKNLL